MTEHAKHLDAALRQHMAGATVRARRELGSTAAVTIVLQVLADDVLRVIYCVGFDVDGRFQQLGLGDDWSSALAAAKAKLATEGR